MLQESQRRSIGWVLQKASAGGVSQWAGGRGGGGLAGEGSLMVKGREKPLEKAGLDLVSKNRE